VQESVDPGSITTYHRRPSLCSRIQIAISATQESPRSGGW
jgi:hypothetical protein